MANQNFRVKKGLEVGLGATYLYADDTGVGINSIAPRANLDVRGTGYIDQLEVGPGTSLIGVGQTYLKVNGDALVDGDLTVTGDLRFDDATLDSLNVTGIATINQLDFNTGVGSVLGVSTLTVEDGLTVNGESTFNEFVTIDAPLGITSSVGIARTLFVGGDVQIGGGITFKGDVTVEIDIEVVGNINQSPSGIATFGTLNFDVGVGNTLTVDYLTVNEDIQLNGAGIATLGGDVDFNTITVDQFAVIGVGNTLGLSTVAQNLEVQKDLIVGGDITLADLESGNITVGGTVTTNGLVFNVGVGTDLTLEDLTVTGNADINGAGIATLGGDVSFNTVDVDQFVLIGTGNTLGVSTVYQNLEVQKDLIVGGDITLADLESGNITVGGTVTTNGLVFNTGIGTELTVGFLSATNSIVGGASTFVGVSSFQGDVSIGGTLRVTGDLIVDDITYDHIEGNSLDISGISTMATAGIDNLAYNVGVGTTAIIGFASITDAQIAIATVGQVNVTGFATFGGLNTTGFSTFFQNLEITGDLKVGGNIDLEDLLADGISIGGTITTNNLIFNTGFGTDLTISGISSLNIITGIGSELQYLPAGSISTSVGITSTTPPTERPTGEPVQAGDLWFDSLGLRQYTYYVGLNSLGVYEGNWIDSNPPPIQPNLQFSADYGTIGEVDIANDIFNIKGTTDQIVTNNPPAILGTGSTITLGLSTNVSILGDFEAGGSVTGTAATFSGSGTFGSISASSAVFDSLNIQDIIVDDLDVKQIGIDTLSFNVGVGTTLTVQDLSVTGSLEVDGVGIATLGGDANFNNLEVVGFTTLGFTTVKGDLYVSGDLFVSDDLTFDEATLRNITVTESSTLNSLTFNVGVGTTLSVLDKVSVGGSLTVDDSVYIQDNVDIGQQLTVAGISSFSDNAAIDGELLVTGDIRSTTGSINAINGNVNASNVTATNSVSFDSASGNTITSLVQANFQEVGFTTATGNRVILDTLLQNTGVSTFTGDIEFFNAVGYDLKVEKLTVTANGEVNLPGIPIQGGAAEFSTLTVNNATLLEGNLVVQGITTVGELNVDSINIPDGGGGGTGISSTQITSDSITANNLLSTLHLNVGGASTFVGVGTFQNDLYVADDLLVKRNLLVGGIATVGTLTATDARITNLVIDGTLEGSGGDAIIIDGDSVISGIVTIGGNSITLDGRLGQEQIEIGTGSGNIIAGLNTFTNDPSHVAVDEGRFNTFITVSGLTSTSTFVNNVQIGGDLNVDGELTFPGGSGIGSDSLTTGEITADTITVGFITAANASVAGIITAQDFNSLSDRRVKENIRNIEDPLEKVDKINGVHFDFINSGKKSMGVIAQEVEEVFPELISGSYPISVNYNGLIGLLIESVKELKAQNISLQERIEILEEKS